MALIGAFIRTKGVAKTNIKYNRLDYYSFEVHVHEKSNLRGFLLITDEYLTLIAAF